MTNVQTSFHYDNSAIIKFYPDSHKYKLDGRKDFLIGVTTATGMKDKSRPLMIWASRLTRDFLIDAIKDGLQLVTPELIEEAVNLYNVKREEAATSGTMVHDWAEQYIKGKNPEVPEDEKVRNGVLAFMKWVNENGVNFEASEKKVYSKKHEYVGTMDAIFTMECEDHKILHAGDFKTGSGIYADQAFQVSAYQAAETEEHGTKFGSKWIIRFIKEDKFDKYGKLTQSAGDFCAKEFLPSEHESHFKGFLGCLEIKKQDKIWEKEHGYYSKKK